MLMLLCVIFSIPFFFFIKVSRYRPVSSEAAAPQLRAQRNQLWPLAPPDPAPAPAPDPLPHPPNPDPAPNDGRRTAGGAGQAGRGRARGHLPALRTRAGSQQCGGLLGESHLRDLPQDRQVSNINHSPEKIPIMPLMLPQIWLLARLAAAVDA